MKKQKSFAQRLIEDMDLPGENLPRQPLLELCGDRRILIENHGGVTEYGKERIQVRVRYGAISVSGDELRLCRMSGQQLVIMGKIDTVTVLRGRF